MRQSYGIYSINNPIFQEAQNAFEMDKLELKVHIALAPVDPSRQQLKFKKDMNRVLWRLAPRMLHHKLSTMTNLSVHTSQFPLNY